MAYIIVVNPAILSFPGIPQGPSTVATILAAAFGSFMMGIYANRPIAVAPYMGENVYLQRRIRGGILLGITATAVLGFLAGEGEAPRAVLALPFVGEFSLGAIALKLDILGMLCLVYYVFGLPH